MNASLTADSICFAYPRRSMFGKGTADILRGLTLQLTPGSSTALIGSSGSGKSTLVRVLLALARPSGGSVSYGGRRIKPGPVRDLRWYRRAVQYVPQNPSGSLDPRMSLFQLLLEPLRHLRVEGNHRMIVRQALDRVELPATMLDRRPGELSGGQNQRAALARALVVSPKYLLADEPVSGLDLPLRDTVLALLDDLVRRDGLGLLLVTHDLTAAARMCGSTAVLSEGRIVEQGPTLELLDNPQHLATRVLLDAATSLQFPRPNPVAPAGTVAAV